MNLLQIIFVAVGAIALYEFFAKPYFLKRKIAKIEKETIQWANMIGRDGVVNAEDEKKDVEALLRAYENTKFDQNQIVLKFEIAKMLYLYVNTVFRILLQHGIQITAVDRDGAQGTVEKLTTLEKQRGQLENVLKNVLRYLKDTNNEDEHIVNR